MAETRHEGTGLRILRCLCFWVLAPILTLLGAVVATLCVPFSPRTSRWSQWMERMWAGSLLAAAGARLHVEGLDRVQPGAPRMWVANHSSFLDPPALMASLPGLPRFVMKRELRRLPFLGWYVALGRHLLIDRSSVQAGMETLSEALRRAKKYGLSPVIFPEGTRSLDGRLQALKPGSFLPAIEGGLTVQPVAILGTREILPKRAWAPRRSGDVFVRVGEPIRVAGLEGSQGRKVLAERVRQALVSLGVPE